MFATCMKLLYKCNKNESQIQLCVLRVLYIIGKTIFFFQAWTFIFLGDRDFKHVFNLKLKIKGSSVEGKSTFKNVFLLMKTRVLAVFELATWGSVDWTFTNCVLDEDTQVWQYTGKQIHKGLKLQCYDALS